MNNRQTTKRYLPLLWLCLVALLMSCGTMRKASSSQKTPAEEQKDPLTPEQRRKYDYFFLEALRMKEKGDLDAAFEMYSHCLDIYPQGAATLYEIAKFYMFLNQPDKGERALKEAVAARIIIGIIRHLLLIIRIKGRRQKQSMFMKTW